MNERNLNENIQTKIEIIIKLNDYKKGNVKNKRNVANFSISQKKKFLMTSYPKINSEKHKFYIFNEKNVEKFLK